MRTADVRCILLRSEGRVFCAGADLANANPVAEERRRRASAIRSTSPPRKLFAVQKPVVAAVQGAAVGAGLGLALVADFRVASPEARFVANFVQLGFHPGFGISAVLERVVGRQRAALMLLTGRRIGGEQAAEWGLADVLVAPDELDAAALALAQEIADRRAAGGAVDARDDARRPACAGRAADRSRTRRAAMAAEDRAIMPKACAR